MHDCKPHLYHFVLLMEQLFQESALEMALQEQNRREYHNYRGGHPRAQVAIPSTTASRSGSDLSEDNETLSWPIFVKSKGSCTILLVGDNMSIASRKNAIYDRLNIPPHAHSLTTNCKTAFLVDHVTIHQCGIMPPCRCSSGAGDV